MGALFCDYDLLKAVSSAFYQQQLDRLPFQQETASRTHQEKFPEGVDSDSEYTASDTEVDAESLDSDIQSGFEDNYQVQGGMLRNEYSAENIRTVQRKVVSITRRPENVEASPLNKVQHFSDSDDVGADNEDRLAEITRDQVQDHDIGQLEPLQIQKLSPAECHHSKADPNHNHRQSHPDHSGNNLKLNGQCSQNTRIGRTSPCDSHHNTDSILSSKQQDLDRNRDVASPGRSRDNPLMKAFNFEDEEEWGDGSIQEEDEEAGRGSSGREERRKSAFTKTRGKRIVHSDIRLQALTYENIVIPRMWCKKY